MSAAAAAARGGPWRSVPPGTLPLQIRVTACRGVRLPFMTAIAAGLGFALQRRDDADLMARIIDRLRGTATSRDSEDAALVERLRDGDEAAFAELIDRYGASMLRVARMHVRDRAVAEEVVQETWLAVINGIERFEGRSSLRTWL